MTTLDYILDVNKRRRLDHGDVLMSKENPYIFRILPTKCGKILKINESSLIEVKFRFRESNVFKVVNGKVEDNIIIFSFDNLWIKKWDKVDTTITVIEPNRTYEIGRISFSVQVSVGDIEKEIENDGDNEYLTKLIDNLISKKVLAINQSRIFQFKDNEDSWYIYYGTKTRPIIEIIDTDGRVVKGDIHYHNDTAISVYFSEPVNGYAILK